VKSTKGNNSKKGRGIVWILSWSADDVYFWAKWGLAGSLILGVVLTIAVIVSGNIKEATLKRELATAQLETQKVKALVSWREITDENRTKFKAFVANAPKGHIEVGSLASDAEGANFARQISDMLKDAGYAVTDNFGSLMPFGQPPVGVSIELKSTENEPTWAAPLQNAFTAIGIDAGGRLNEALEESTVLVFVGCKP
jgi:hypothetical protein